jgi:hypothetical protein
VKEGVLDAALQTVGWPVIISNDINDAKEPLRIYRAKDVVEKKLLRLKCDLDLGRLRVQEIGDQRIVFPATKTQRQTFEAFGINVPL